MLKDYKNIVDAIASEIIAYEEKPTKTRAARIRKLSLQLDKQGAMLRALTWLSETRLVNHV